jgi:hypothetical protein
MNVQDENELQQYDEGRSDESHRIDGQDHVISQAPLLPRGPLLRIGLPRAIPKPLSYKNFV